jgi:peptidoglycan hydrolase-like protein with peptidoglycan-binding domain
VIKKFSKLEFIALLIGCSVIGSCAYVRIASTARAADFAFTQNLAVGAQGNDVSVLQRFLIAGGYLDIATSTGRFGSLTAAALGAWQASVGISPSIGNFGPVSRGKINAIMQPTAINAVVGSETAVSAAATVDATSTAVVNDEIGLPMRLVIPKLSIDAGFQNTGVKSDGTMEVPSNIYDVGWFTDSARPGEKGVAIVTGHVAQIRGGVVVKPGVFSDLSDLNPGNELTILDDKKKTITFVVRMVRSYDPAADATDVFTANDNGAHLNLITCEGSWNASRLSYTERLVVFTDAVK